MRLHPLLGLTSSPITTIMHVKLLIELTSISLNPGESFPLLYKLIDRCDINLYQKDNYGYTFLHNFVRYYCPTHEEFHSFAEHLTDNGHSKLFSITDSFDMTPVQVALTNFKVKEETLTLLYTSGVEFSDKTSPSYLSCVVMGNINNHLLPKLISYGADMSTGFKDINLVQLAVSFGNINATRFLLNYGPELKASEKNCLLRTAIEHESQFDDKNPLYATMASVNPVEMVRLLIDHGANVNAKDNNGRTPLHLAADRKDTTHTVELIKLLIQNGADPQAVTKDGSNFLHLLNFYGLKPSEFHSIAELLVEIKCTYLFNAIGDWDEPIIFSMNNMKSEPELRTIYLLCENGVKFNVLDGKKSLLVDALYAGRTIPFLKSLIDCGAELNPKGLARNLLDVAIQVGNTEAVRFLANLDGIDINKKSRGETPLIKALVRSYEEVEIPQILLGNGADPNIRGKDGFTPLGIVAYYKPGQVVELIKLLIQHGADPFAPYKQGENSTFLHLLFRQQDKLTPEQFHSLAEYLIESGLERLYDFPGQFGYTPLHFAVMNGVQIKNETFAILHLAGVDFNVFGDDGYSLLKLAINREGSVEMLNNLIKYCDLRYIDSVGNTLLHHAAYKGSIAQLKYLLGREEFDVNLINEENGNTPIHLALLLDIKSEEDMEYFREKLKVLIDERAEVNAKNFEGWTALFYVAQRKQTEYTLELIKLLVKNGADPKARSRDGFTFIHFLNYRQLSPDQFHEIVKETVRRKLASLFNAGCDVDHSTPLHIAIELMEPEKSTMHLLFENGVDFKAKCCGKGNSSYSYLTFAIVAGRSTKFLEVLIGFGNDPYYGMGDAERDLLRFAIIKGKVEALKFLVGLGGFDLNAEIGLEGTLLEIALKQLSSSGTSGMVEIVRVLLKNGAIPNRRFRRELMKPSIKDPKFFIEVIKLIIDNGADPVEFAEENGRGTFLHVLFRVADISSITPEDFHIAVEYLVKEGFAKQFNIPFEGKTPLHLMARFIQVEEETLGLLHSKGIDFNVDWNGDEILILEEAIREGGGEEILEGLIKYGADTKYVDWDGNSLLHKAALKGSSIQLKYLLSRGEIEVNSRNKDGKTALHFALNGEKDYEVVEKVRILLEHGADVAG